MSGKARYSWAVLVSEMQARANAKNTAEAVFTFDDGSQVLLTLWDDNTFTAAKRGEPAHTWGAPADGIAGWHA